MSGEASEAKKAVWKKPEAMCECIKWMEENDLMRYGETLGENGEPGLMPIIDPHRRRRNAPYAPIKFCPNCGEPTFDVIEGEATQ